MSKFEIQPRRSRRIWAVLIALAAAFGLIYANRASSRIAAVISLLLSWDLAFVPSPPFNKTLGEIYGMARQGWRMSRATRVITYVNFGLTILYFYLLWHGR